MSCEARSCGHCAAAPRSPRPKRGQRRAKARAADDVAVFASAISSQVIRPKQRPFAYGLAWRLRNGLQNLVSTGLIYALTTSISVAAAIPQPQAPGQLVGVNIENTSDATMAPRFISFGQVFRAGQLPPGHDLRADIVRAEGANAESNSLPLPVQIDVKATYPDGSARIGVVTVQSPEIAGRQTLPLMLSLTDETEPSAASKPAVDLTNLLNTYDMTLDLTLRAATETTAYHLDVLGQLVKLLRDTTLQDGGLRAPVLNYWRRGPLADEIRLDIPVLSSLHLVFDVTAYADGSHSTDVQFRNDQALGKVGGALNYDVTISLGGKTMFRQPAVRQFQYQSWHVAFWSNGKPDINVQHDVAALERTGLVANYDLATGVGPSVRAEQTRAMAAPGWHAPLAANEVAQYMSITNGRGDVGPTTRANAVWLMTQSPEAAAFALAQADAAGAIPWQFWNEPAGTWLNTASYPDIWVDSRGGAGSYTTGLTQPVDPRAGWATDTAHQPDLTFVAYLMTGQRRYLDLLNAQAAFSVTDTWPDPQARNKGEGNVIRGNPLRAAAWSLREIDEAALANPRGSAEQIYFTRIANNNWRWLVEQLAIWSKQEGETAGYILPSTYEIPGMFPPWQQDYFVTIAVQAAEQGNRDALTYLKWAENFIAGRFLNGAAGFHPHNGISYLIGNVVDGAVCKTWAQLQAATAAKGQDNANGWSHSDADYAELALAALAGLINVTGSTRAAQAYQYLVTAGAPHTAISDRQTNVELNIVPRTGQLGQ